MRSLCIISVLLSLAGSAAGAGDVAQASASHVKAVTHAAKAPAGINLPEFVGEAYPVDLDLPALVKLAPGQTLELPVQAGLTLNAKVTNVESRGVNKATISGIIEGEPGSLWHIVVEEDVAAAQILVPSKALNFMAYSNGPGTHVLVPVFADKAQPCASEFAHAPNLPPVSRANADDFGMPQAMFDALMDDELARKEEENFSMDPLLPKGAGNSPPPPPGTCVEPISTFDIAVFYTNNARANAGSTNAIVANIVLAVQAANDAYDTSGIRNHMRLVYAAEVSYDETTATGGSPYLTHLNRESNGSDGILDQIPPTRDSVNADVAALFVEDNRSGGIAWCQADASNTYAVVRWEQSASTYTLAHEVGHNQGCAHDRANVDCSGRDAYSFGWVFNGNSGTQWGTVMSYPGSRCPNFSNPYVNVDGQPSGNLPGTTNQAYNAKTIDDNRFNFEGFKLTRYDIWLDFNFSSFIYIGTYAFPYTDLGTSVGSISPRFANATDYPNLYIKSATHLTNNAMTISKSMTIRACGGPVTIGHP